MAGTGLVGRSMMTDSFSSLDAGVSSSAYQQFNGVPEGPPHGGGIIIDTPSHFDNSSSQGGLPDPVDVIKWFEEYIEVMSPISEEEEDKLRQHSVEEKWKILFNEQTREPISSASFYIETVKRFVSSANDKKKHRNSTRRSAKDITAAKTLSHILKKLKLDLKMSFDSFVEQFIDDKHNGVQLLVALLLTVQHEQSASMSLTKKHRAELYKQTLLDEYDCLLCIKFALRIERGVTQLLKHSEAIDTISLCLMSHFRKTTTVALEILTRACSLPFGYRQVEDTMMRQRIKFGESVRFKMLISMINSGSNVHFQAICVRFFNRLWDCHETANFRVYFQQELELAGFDPDAIDRYSVGDSPDFEELQRELDTWRKNYINVTTGRQEITDLENRNSYLRVEIDRLQETVSEITNTMKSLEKDQQQWKEKCDRYRERAAALQDTVEKLSHLYKEKIGDVPEGEVNLDDAARPLDTYATVRGLPRSDTSSSFDQTSELSYDPPPTPAAPPPPPSFLSQTIRKKVVTKVNLPLFNWTPLYSIRKTIFEDIDDEAKLREIDFTDFEAKFHLPVKEESKESKSRREKAIQRVTNKILFVDINRSKNMIITKKRTGLTAREIRRAIETCDVTVLPGEYAELLLKYIPTKEEVKQLATHAKEYSRMGEAEQLLFQMAQIDRLDSRLSTLAFVGIFDELLASVKPKLECIYLASLSVSDSKKLRKICEIILAFGNYMNSSKRGYVLGYKLESLLKVKDIKSTDRATTLIHYLVELMESKYPELLNFFDELSISIEKGVSYQGIASDLQGLRKGIDLIKYEMDRSHNANPRIEEFHAKASTQVAEMAEAFKKMEEAYKRVCHMFGENYRNIEPDELFKYISDFIVDFKTAVADRYAASHVSTPKPLPRRKYVSTSQSPREVQSNVVRRTASLKTHTRPNINAQPTKTPFGARNSDLRKRWEPASVEESPNMANAEFLSKTSLRNSAIEPSIVHENDIPSVTDLAVPKRAASVSAYENVLRLKDSSSKVYKANRPSQPPSAQAKVTNGQASRVNGAVPHGGKVNPAKSNIKAIEKKEIKSDRMPNGRVNGQEISPVPGSKSKLPNMVNGHSTTPSGRYADQETEALNRLDSAIDNYDGISAPENESTAL